MVLHTQNVPPFVAAFDPFVLFGLDPPSPYQLYGVHLAFHTYHACRQFDCISPTFLECTIKSYTRGCKTYNHLVKAHAGRIPLKFSPSFPSSRPPLGDTSSYRSASAFLSTSTSGPFQHEISDSVRTFRSSLPVNRQAFLRARRLL